MHRVPGDACNPKRCAHDEFEILRRECPREELTPYKVVKMSCIETRQFLSPAEKMFDCHHDRERGGMSVGSPGPLLDGDDHPPETIQLLIGRQLSEPAPGAWRQPGAQHPFVGLQETLDAHFIKLRQAAKQ